jgi:hypothetical protein
MAAALGVTGKAILRILRRGREYPRGRDPERLARAVIK